MSTPDQQPPQPAGDATPNAATPGYTPPAFSTPPADQPAYGASTDAAGYAAPAYGAAPEPVPGRGLAIAGLILAIFVPVVGLILSIVARVKLKKAGAPTGMATAGIIVGAILTVFWIVVAIVAVMGLLALAAMCAELGTSAASYSCG